MFTCSSESRWICSSMLCSLETSLLSSKTLSASLRFSLFNEKYPEIDSVTPQNLPLTTCNAFVMKKFCTELLWLNILSAAISRAMKTAVLMIVPVMVRCLGICLPLQERAVAYMLQCDACSSCHGVKRIFCHVERNVHLLRETGVQTSEQCAAS